MRREIRISGFGGQGVVLLGYVLGRASALHTGLEAVMTQSYGPEARGGASSANLVLADRPIDYPFIQQADIFVALSQEGYSRYRSEARPDAVVIIDRDLVAPHADETPFAIPATELAESLGRRIVANMVMLGYFSTVVDLIPPNALREALESTVRPSTLALNLEAFDAGRTYERQGVVTNE